MNKLSNALRNCIHRRQITLLVLALLVATLYTYTVAIKISHGGSDFIAHAKVAEGILQGAQIPPHFLYQLVLITLQFFSKISFIHASLLAVFLMVLTTFMIAYINIKENSFMNEYFAGLMVCFLLLSHPITILFPYDHHLYYGYVATNVYHNPSILLLKIFALLHFTLLCKLLTHKKNAPHIRTNIFILAFLTAITIITKPNYIIALLPALLGLILFNKYFRKNFTHIIFITTCGVGLPAFIILLGQYYYFYGPGNTNSLNVSFFEVYNTQSHLWTIIPKLVASIAFPISLIIVMKTKLTQRFDTQLSAATLIVSLIYSYCLVDNVGGQGTAAGNFWWSAQISSFIFLFVCIKAYANFILDILKENKNQIPKIAYFPAIIGLIQFIFGIIWCFSNILLSYWKP